MNRAVALAAAASLTLLAGCGEPCRGEPTEAVQLPASCTLAANASTSIEVQLCPKCTDSSPSCTAELVNGRIELDTTFARCESNASCDIQTGCGIANNRVRCFISAPLEAGKTYDVVAGTNQLPGTVAVQANASTSCSL